MDKKEENNNKRMLYMEGFFIMLGGGMVQVGTTLTNILIYLIPQNVIIIGLFNSIISFCAVVPKFFTSKLILSKEVDSPIMARMELIKGLLWILLGIIILQVQDKTIAGIIFFIILGIIFMILGANATIRTDIIGKLIKGNERGKFLGTKEFISRIGGLIAVVIGSLILTSFPRPLNFAVIFWAVGGFQTLSYIVLNRIREKRILRDKKQKPMKDFMKATTKMIKADKNLRFMILQDNLKILGLALVPMFIVYLKDKVALNDVDMMILTGCSMFGVALFSIVFGKLSDAKGCKCVVEFSYFVYILTYALMFFAQNNLTVYLSYFLLGASAAGELVTRDNISIILGKERNRALYESLRSTATLPFTIASPLVMAMLIQYIGYNFVFVIEIFFILASMYIINNKVEINEEMIEEIDCSKNLTVC